jgi:hypothetical protein
MAATNFTPIQLYRSSTAAAVPLAADLAAGELAINTTDEKLYFENASGVVKLLASSAATGGTFTTVTATTVVNGLGAVGTPSYTFTGDLNTGMWSPATGNIAVSTGGVERMRIGSSGNVGIGTASPGSFGLLAAVLNATGVTTIAVSNSNATTNDGAKLSSFYGTIEMSSLGHYWNGSTFIGRQYSYGDLTFLLGSTPAERMRIDSSGNVGIGTSAPARRLHVVAADGGTNSLFAGASYALRVQSIAATGTVVDAVNNTEATYQPLLIGGSQTQFMVSGAEKARLVSDHFLLGTTANPSVLNTSVVIDSGANSLGGVVMQNNTTGRTFSDGGHLYMSGAEMRLYNAENNVLMFGTNNTERMRIDTSGNVGIGTSSPTYRLDVASGDTTASIGYAMRIRSNATATAAAMQFTNSAGSSQTGLVTCTDTGTMTIQSDGASSLLAFRTNGNERMRIDSSGNVGVGTTAPTRRLSISGGDVELNANVLYLNSGNAFIQGNSTNILFSTNATERMRLDSSGNLGIGTSAPQAKLSVVVASSAGTSLSSFANYIAVGPNVGTVDGSGLGLSYNTTADTAEIISVAPNVAWKPLTIYSLGLRFNVVTGTEIARFDNNGRLGLGTTTPAYQLELSTDSAAKPSTNTWTIVSDSRIKTETGEYTKGLDAVCALRPITYHYNGVAGFVDDGKENISIIAQEAMQHFPECVGTFEMLLNEGDEEKTELFNWNGHALTFALVNAVKELKAVNDALTARVAQLEGK